MNFNAPNSTSSTTEDVSRETRDTPARARSGRVTRGRGRLETETRGTRGRTSRARRATPERRERVDLDGVYLTEMAASTVLSAEQEVELAERIAGAERKILAELVRSPSGAEALERLGSELERDVVDIRDVLLNPDQDGLDLPAVRVRVQQALAKARRDDEHGGRAPADASAQETLVSTLADVRFDNELTASIIAGISEAAGLAPASSDAEAFANILRAQRQLKRDKERFVVGNLRLVVLFARKYLNRGVPLLDLIQEGNLGLMRAADKFDHRRGFRFSTYAAWWIKQALQRALLDRTLRLPVHVADDRRRVGKIRAAFQAQHRREPTAEEIASASGLAKERIENILSLPAQPASLDTPMGEDGDGSLGDIVPSQVTPPDHQVAMRALASQLGGMLDSLTPREQQVVRMRFGIGETREHTLEEVGRALSLTRERIRQIERAALDKLRARSERVQLRSYLEL